MLVSALTTLDNPFDPFDQFDEWFNYDETKGYHSSAYLARIAATSSSFTAEETAQAINDAIDEICQFNLTGNYKKVTREV